MLFHAIYGRQLELLHAPVCDVANVVLDVRWRHAFHIAHLESQIDELVFEIHRGLAAIGDIVLDGLGERTGFFREGVEHLHHAFAVQRFIAHRPRHDLAHTLHLVEPWEVHQHGERSEQLKAFGEPTEHGHGCQDVFFRTDTELAKKVMLGCHFLVFHEGGKLRIRHADGFQQQRVGRDVHGLHVGKCRQHHAHFNRLEERHVVFHVVRADFHI